MPTFEQYEAEADAIDDYWAKEKSLKRTSKLTRKDEKIHIIKGDSYE